MKKKSFVLCLLLLVLSLSSCKKKIELEEKKYWEENIESWFTEDKIYVTIDKNFSNREFTVEDFKEINIIQCDLYKTIQNDDGSINKEYYLTLSTKSKQNVIDCIRIIREYDFVKYAEPEFYDLSD